MEISRLPNNPPPVQGRAPQPSTPPPAQPSDQFEPGTPAPPKVGKKVWGAVSLTGTVGMFVGARWGASMGHPALGFAVGTLVGGAIGFGLASFAYSGKPS